MMFECAVYNDNLRFPRNVQAELNPHASKDAKSQARIDELSLELTKRQLETHKKRKEHMRLTLPISGEVSKPSGGYLREIYYILEEHNKQLMENALSKMKDATDPVVPIDIDRQRKLILPTQMWRVFDSPNAKMTYHFFPTAIKSQSPLVPGQMSTITLQEPHRKVLVEQIRSTNLFGVGVAFVQPATSPQEEAEISPHVCMCEFVDISDLDTTGKIVVRAVQRLSIVDILDSKEAVLRVEVKLLNDERVPLRNPVLTNENARAIAKLYDKCNVQEAYLSRISGRMEDVEIIECREPFSEKMSRLIKDVPLDKNHELAILELTGFAALEFHADTDTKLWAANIRDTEERLASAKVVLEEKNAYLKEHIKQIRGRTEPIGMPDLE
ncbi:hypothetical protein BgAZ_107330 [Babesia gibsoni]|uniref:Lon N-terminal domain-containing protein n=1 Tax=Babesia gibsoni TaxID=33632 RepID=A0AAD8PGC3_BABGI|nr:hypothetical protein BgAZ_107330 [Babesia gibsoni]